MIYLMVIGYWIFNIIGLVLWACAYHFWHWDGRWCLAGAIIMDIDMGLTMLRLTKAR